MVFEEFCIEFKQMLRDTQGIDNIFAAGRPMLAKLAKNPGFLENLFTSIVTDEQFYSQRPVTLDDNEVTIYRDPDRQFSVRLYVWDPVQMYPIHDHGSWGMVACLAGALQETAYRRMDDGSKPAYADIQEKSRNVLHQGDITTMLPLDQGIHKFDAVSATPGVTLHVYGKAVRKGFIQLFNFEQQSVKRLYPPKMCERISVLRSLASIDTEWSRDLLSQGLESRREYEVFEAKRSLEILGHS